jgi:ABC transport system ATP-binding/permease protein
LFINTVEAPLLAFILAYFTKRFTFFEGIPTYVFGGNPNIPAFLFMSVIVALFLGMVISAEEIFKDRKILKREKFLNLSRSSYLFSKITILFTISALQAFVFVAIGNYMLEIRGMLWSYWLILFTTSCWANLIGLNISSGLNSVVTIYILVPLILVPQLLFSGVVVDFDKMHNHIASEKNVPLIGDMMTSRWAYESLMVTQFKKNEYERHFYEAEAQIKNTTYFKSFEIPGLRNLENESERLLKSQRDSLKLNQNLNIITSEVIKISNSLEMKQPVFVDSLALPLFNNKVGLSLNRYLDGVEKKYILMYNIAVNKRDGEYSRLVTKLGGSDQFQTFKEKFYNKQVADVVANENEMHEFDIQNKEMVRIKDAIFRTPESNIGRAHFYAPVKLIAHVAIDTFWFNLIFIWLYSGLLFVLLYYDILRRIILYFDTLRLNRINKKRFLGLWVTE